MADKATALVNLQSALKAYEENPFNTKDGRDTAEFVNINRCIRVALQVLGEDPFNPDTLLARGLLMTPYNEPVPDSYLSGIRTLVVDLQQA